MKYFIAILFLSFLSSASYSQKPKPAAGSAAMGYPVTPAVKSTEKYSDSVQFKAEFKELYGLIKASPTVDERTEKIFGSMARMFKARGVDSGEAYSSVMKTIDKSMDEKILYDEYRKDFSAEELKPMIVFFKTPAGRHYLEVEGSLSSARGQAIDGYVRRTIMSAVTPMMKPVEAPPRAPGAMNRPNLPPSAGGVVTRPGLPTQTSPNAPPDSTGGHR